MNIFLAQPQHLETLAPLFDAYRIFYKQESDIESAKNFLRHLINNQEATIFVVMTEDGKGMGFTTLYPSYSSVSMAPIFVLNDLFVHPDHRQKHVGELLLNQAASWAKSQGAIRMQLETETSNHSAQNLYKKLDWKLESEYNHYVLDLKDQE